MIYEVSIERISVSILRKWRNRALPDIDDSTSRHGSCTWLARGENLQTCNSSRAPPHLVHVHSTPKESINPFTTMGNEFVVAGLEFNSIQYVNEIDCFQSEIRNRL